VLVAYYNITQLTTSERLTSTRRKPFSTWVKRFTSLKHNSSNGSHSKSRRQLKNNPYPESALPFHQPSSNYHDAGSITSYDDGVSTRNGRVQSMRSAAPTVATTIHSDAGHSKAPTSHTNGGAMSYRDGAANSTFSSPQQSQESLTTTFTTLQSTAPSAMLGHNQQNTQTPPTTGHNQAYVTQSQNSNHPVTYNQAIANNLLTDNASLLTLASSSKRRRRRSLDTDAWLWPVVGGVCVFC